MPRKGPLGKPHGQHHEPSLDLGAMAAIAAPGRSNGRKTHRRGGPCCWFAERDEILARWRHWGHYGRRPPDWWRFEAQRAYPGWDREAAALFEMGELRPDELALLMTEWRSYFDKVQSPDWAGMCVGQSEAGEAIWLTGKKGRQRWYEWAGIPLEVIEGFNAERIAR